MMRSCHQPRITIYGFDLFWSLGPIRTVTQALQVVNMEEDRERISARTDKKDRRVPRSCFEEAREMDELANTKNIRHYRLKMAAGKHVSWTRSVSALYHLGLYIKEITRKLFL